MRTFWLLCALVGCRGTTEPADAETDCPTTPWHADADADGYGDPDTLVDACEAPGGHVADGTDCDDDAAGTSPEGVETCDRSDEDCDGVIDEEASDASVWYTDADGDGYGDPATAVTACAAPEGGIANGDDPDDADPTRPGVFVGDWTQQGGNAAHTGYLPGAAGDAELEPLWSWPATTELNPVVVAGGVVYASGALIWDEQPSLFALDRWTGDELWSATPAGSGHLNPPAWGDDALFLQQVFSADSHLQRWDAGAGTLDWERAYPSQWTSYLSPAVADGGVWMPGGDYWPFQLLGYDQDGDLRFSVEIAGGVELWTPAYADGVVYALYGPYLEARDAKTGELLWQVSFPGEHRSTSPDTAAVVSDGVVYAAGAIGLHAVDAATGAILWSVGGDFLGLPSVDGASIYAATGNAVERRSLADGALEHEYRLDAPLRGQAIVTDDLLIAPTGLETTLFDKETGAERQVLDFGGDVAVGNGLLVVAGHFAEVRAWRWRSH